MLANDIMTILPATIQSIGDDDVDRGAPHSLSFMPLMAEQFSAFGPAALRSFSLVPIARRNPPGTRFPADCSANKGQECASKVSNGESGHRDPREYRATRGVV